VICGSRARSDSNRARRFATPVEPVHGDLLISWSLVDRFGASREMMATR